MTVEQLRKDGYQVSVSHYRLTPSPPWVELLDNGKVELHTTDIRHQRYIKENKLPFVARGGLTFVVIEDTDGTRATSYAACSHKDNYNKKLGREIAIGRAMKKLREGGDTI